MSQPGISAPAEITLYIDDDFMERNVNDASVEIDIIAMTPTEAFLETKIPRTGQGGFEPRGIKVSAARDGTGVDETAASAFLNVERKNDPRYYRSRYNCGQVSPERIRKIKPYQSTARHIEILG